MSGNIHEDIALWAKAVNQMRNKHCQKSGYKRSVIINLDIFKCIFRTRYRYAKFLLCHKFNVLRNINIHVTTMLLRSDYHHILTFPHSYNLLRIKRNIFIYSHCFINKFMLHSECFSAPLFTFINLLQLYERNKTGWNVYRSDTFPLL